MFRAAFSISSLFVRSVARKPFTNIRKINPLLLAATGIVIANLCGGEAIAIEDN